MTTYESTDNQLSSCWSDTATSITLASPDINPLNGLRADYWFYPFSNDKGLQRAYRKAHEYRVNNELITPPDEAQHYATMIVGNGSFESAQRLIPEQDIIIFIDQNPLTLFLQRAIIETIKAEPTLPGFKNSFLSVLAGLESMSHQQLYSGSMPSRSDRFLKARSLAQEAHSRKQSWKKDSRLKLKQSSFFTASKKAYNTARDSIEKREFSFYQIDLRDAEQIQKLGNVLRIHGVILAEANVTNVFDGVYAKCGVLAVQNSLPWHSDALVISTGITERGCWRPNLHSVDMIGQNR